MEVHQLSNDIRPHPSAVVLIERHALIEGFVHCDLDPSACCCTSSNNDGIKAAETFYDFEPTTGNFEKVTPVGTTVARPQHSGNSCHDCGGMMQRTGTCETCTECGTTGGCG